MALERASSMGGPPSSAPAAPSTSAGVPPTFDNIGGSRQVTLGRHDKVGSDFRSLFLDSDTHDTLILCGAETLVAHRVVLLARSREGFFGPKNSKRWRKRTTNGVTLDVIELNELEPDIISKVLEYVYTGMVAVDPEQLLPVAIAADFLQVDGLSFLCAEQLVGTATLENAFENLDVLTAHSASLKPAIDHYVHFIGKHAAELLDCEDILMLREPAMAVLLSSDVLSCPEEEIFDSFLKWGLHNCDINTMNPTEWPTEKHDKLKEFLASTAPLIRLQLMPPKFLIDVVEPTGLFSASVLMNGYRSRCLELSRQIGELETHGGKTWYVTSFGDGTTFEAELRDFTHANFKPKEFLESPRVRLGNTSFSMNVKFYPKGLDETDPDPSSGLYLKVMPSPGARVHPDWKCEVKYRLILNDGSISRDYSSATSNGSEAARAVSHTFTRNSLDWGYKKFTKLTRILDMMSTTKTKSLCFRVIIMESKVQEPTLEEAMELQLSVNG